MKGHQKYIKDVDDLLQRLRARCLGQDIPLDVLKLDAEFFRGEDETGRGAIIVREAICLARELNMRVVAEGIEHKEQVDFLAGLGCDMIQGFYFAKPMPVEEFETRMAADA